MASNTTNILIFDDEEIVGEIVSRMLTHLGCRSTHVYTLNDAVKTYQENIGSTNAYTAVLADLNIPDGLGGCLLAQKLLALDSGAKIFVTSGDPTEIAMQQPAHYGFVDCVQKPINLSAMQGFIEKI